MMYSIHRFPELFVRDRLQLKVKDEEAEIELTGSPLEEEANMAEIEEDGSTDFINALFMNDSDGFLQFCHISIW